MTEQVVGTPYGWVTIKSDGTREEIVATPVGYVCKTWKLERETSMAQTVPRWRWLLNRITWWIRSL